MEKLLLIILFVAVSYYPLCGIIGLIRYITILREKDEIIDKYKAEGSDKE